MASDACVSRLKKYVPQYRKGVLAAEMQLRLLGQVLDELHTEKAIEPKEQMWFAPNNY